MIPSINACKLALHLLDRDRVQYELQAHIAIKFDKNAALGRKILLMAFEINEVQSMLLDRIHCGGPEVKKRKGRKR